MFNVDKYRKNKALVKEDGFTLVEILVVILVIGILASIAIPVFLNQRKLANDASVESAVHNASVAVQTYFTNNPEAAKVDLVEVKKLMTKNAEVRLTFAGNANAFCIEGDHRNGKKYIADVQWSSLLVFSSTDGKTFVGNNQAYECATVGGGRNVTHVVWP